jgi:uncharacterized protein (DUF2267 family)
MADREFTEFESTLNKTDRILNELEEEMGWQNRRSQTYASMREVLHALRDRLTTNEVIQLAAQMPMLLAGVFINGWRPRSKPVRMNAEEFYDHIQANLPYKIDGGVPRLVKAVWRVMEKNFSKGALSDVMANLPNDLVKSLQRTNRRHA